MTFSAPVELARRPQWVAWELVPRKDDPKPTKVPINARTGRHASTTDPRTWATYEEACAFPSHHPEWECSHPDCTGLSLGIAGSGYVLSKNDPYVGVDLDACRDPETGKVEEWARAVITRLNSYSEVSPSGTGIRIFVKGKLPPRGRRKGQIEIYSEARFLTITGRALQGLPKTIEDRSAELLAWHMEVFGQPAQERTNGHTVVRAPINLADGDLLLKARNAANGAEFWALWNGDWTAYNSQSEADLALVNYLAFWTGPDEGRIDSLFRSSGLMRDKWERADYRAATIGKALESRGPDDYYSGGSASPRLEVSGPEVKVNPDTGEVLESPWRTLGELVRSTPEVMVQYVEGVLWGKLTHWVYSTPGAGKTLFLLAALMHVAAGKDFHGRQVVQGPVLLIEEDSPDSVLTAYVEMLADIYDIDLDAIPFWLNRVRGTRIRDKEGCDYVQKIIMLAPEKPVIVAFDACEKLVPSERFNSSELDALVRLFDWNIANGTANIMIDHTRKPGGAGTDPVDPIDLLYGGRAKSAISDVMLFLSGSIRTKCVVQFTKFRGDAPPNFTMSFDGASGFDIKNGMPKLSENERKVMDVLNNARESVSKADLATQTKLGEKTVQRALAKLIDMRWVETVGTTSDKRFKPAYGAPGVFG